MFSDTETGYGQSVHSCKELVKFAKIYMHLSNVTLCILCIIFLK